MLAEAVSGQRPRKSFNKQVDGRWRWLETVSAAIHGEKREHKMNEFQAVTASLECVCVEGVVSSSRVRRPLIKKTSMGGWTAKL